VHILLLWGFYVIARELQFIGFSSSASQILYFAFALFPAWFGADFSRIYREGFLSALSAIIIGFGIRLFRLMTAERQSTFSRQTVTLSAFIGALVGLFAITKISWQIPLFYLLTLLFFWVSGSAKKIGVKKTVVKTAQISLISGLGFSMIFLPVENINNLRVGVPIVEEFSQGEFPKMLNTLAAIEVDGKREGVLIDYKVRAAAYSVSESFRSLRPFLDSGTSGPWKKISCEATGICDESGLWFPWEIRDAIYGTGKVNSDIEMQNFMMQVRLEIETGCSKKAIKCGDLGIAPMIGPLSKIDVFHVLNAVNLGLTRVLTLNAIRLDRPNFGDVSKDVLSEWNFLIPNIAIQGQNSPSINPSLQKLLDFELGLLRVVFPLSFVLAALGLIFRRNKFSFGLAAAPLMACFSLIFPMALVEASSGSLLSKFGDPYLIGTYPFLLLFIGLGLGSISMQPLALRRARMRRNKICGD
jgi:hypothetical protein